MQLVDLDAVDAAHAGIADMDDRQEAVGDRRAGAARDADMHLVDERLVVIARIACPEITPMPGGMIGPVSAMPKPGAISAMARCTGIGDAVGEIGGRDRA